MIDKKTDQI